MISSENFCRLCAASGGLCVRVFDPEGEKHLLKHKLRVCVPVIVREDDVLPKQVCLTCLSFIDSIYDFYVSSKAAQAKLPALMKIAIQKRRHSKDTNKSRKKLCTSLDHASVPDPPILTDVTKDGAPPLFALIETGGKKEPVTPKSTSSQLQSGDPAADGGPLATSDSPLDEVSKTPKSTEHGHTNKSEINKSCAQINKGLSISKLTRCDMKVKPEFPSPSKPLENSGPSSSAVPEQTKSSSPNLDWSSEKSFPCPTCKRMFSEQALVVHQQKWHDQESLTTPKIKFSCVSCPRSFFSEDAYKRHLQRHQTNRVISPTI